MFAVLCQLNKETSIEALEAGVPFLYASSASFVEIFVQSSEGGQHAHQVVFPCSQLL